MNQPHGETTQRGLTSRPLGSGPALGRTVEADHDGAGHAVHLLIRLPTSVSCWGALAARGPLVPDGVRSVPSPRCRPCPAHSQFPDGHGGRGPEADSPLTGAQRDRAEDRAGPGQVSGDHLDREDADQAQPQGAVARPGELLFRTPAWTADHAGHRAGRTPRTHRPALPDRFGSGLLDRHAPHRGHPPPPLAGHLRRPVQLLRPFRHVARAAAAPTGRDAPTPSSVAESLISRPSVSRTTSARPARWCASRGAARLPAGTHARPHGGPAHRMVTGDVRCCTRHLTQPHGHAAGMANSSWGGSPSTILSAPVSAACAKTS